jgi:hypothetical protein
MRFRILLSFIFLLLISWITYVSLDLLQYESHGNLRFYFNSSDYKIIIIHKHKEVDWEQENFQVSTKNQTLYYSIVPNIKRESSIFISSKRPLILIEQKENWTEKDVKQLFNNGLYPILFRGKRNFSFGEYRGIYSKNQVVIFQGNFVPKVQPILDVDRKASYSIISFKNKNLNLCDVYNKSSGSYLYSKHKAKNLKTSMYDDKKLFSSILPTNFSEYKFFSASYLSEIDSEFKKSDFSKWVDKGLVFIRNKNQSAVIFYFKEGQNPIQNLNEKLNIEERNESSANFKNIPFSNYFKQDIATGFFIEEFNNFAVISTAKSYLDEIITEINLGKSLSQDEIKCKYIYGELPKKVACRVVSGDSHKTKSIYGALALESEFIPLSTKMLVDQSKDKDYFSMNVGEVIKDFLALEGRGNVIVLTQTNKIIAYVDGIRKWEKQLLSNDSQLKEFSSDRFLASLFQNNEAQIIDKNGLVIHRLMSYNNIPPIKYKINNTEFLVVNAPNNIAILNEKGIIIKKFPVFSNIKEIAKYKDGNNTRIGILTENFIYVFEPINRTIIRKIPCDSTSKLFTDNSSIFYAGIEKNILKLINSGGMIKEINIKINSKVIGHFFENNNPVLLIKNTNEIRAIDYNGIVKWKKIMNLSEISSCSVKSGKNGIILIGILDAIENKLYLLNTSGQFIANQDLKGSEKIQITQFGENAFSISTVLGNAVIQYTK